MCEIHGLSKDPSEAYEQGRIDGRAEAFHAVEVAETHTQYAKHEKLSQATVISKQVET